MREQGVTNRQSSTDIFDPILIQNIDNHLDGRTITASEAINDMIVHISGLYNMLLEAGVAKECARMILPMATQTTIYMTGSVRSWIHFLDIRDDGHAQKEAQEIAREIKKIFIEQLPIISAAKEYGTR